MLILFLAKTITLFKIIQIFLVSSIKFVFAPALSFGIGLNYFETILVTTIGGVTGVLFFYYLSRLLILLFYKKIQPIASHSYLLRKTINSLSFIKRMIPKRLKKRRNFTKKNRFLVKVRQRYGLYGIVILTPILLSIPIGSFLASKYYSQRKNILLYLSLSVFVWSCIMSSILVLF